MITTYPGICCDTCKHFEYDGERGVCSFHKIVVDGDRMCYDHENAPDAEDPTVHLVMKTSNT